ncbi:MAG: hypothetical protein WAT81_01760 [Candidatus Moraniibacteriota bacterium]
MKRPSRWFLTTVVLLAWMSLYIGKFSLDVSQMVLSDEIYKNSTLGFPFVFFSETWRPGSEQMHSTVHFSLAWLLVDIFVSAATAVFIGWKFGSKIHHKGPDFN